MIYLGIIGQSIAAVLLIIGVTLQIANGDAAAHIIVTLGAVIFSIFTKIRLIGYEWDEVIALARKRRKR